MTCHSNTAFRRNYQSLVSSIDSLKIATSSADLSMQEYGAVISLLEGRVWWYMLVRGWDGFG
jgi:hypothetical protein